MKISLLDKYEALKRHPGYCKDWVAWQGITGTANDKEFKAATTKFKAKYHVPRLPTPLKYSISSRITNKPSPIDVIPSYRTLISDRTARECLIARKDGQGNWVHKYECRKCGSVDHRGITQRLFQYQYDRLPEDEALETLLDKKEIKKCPNCGEYVEFKKVRARTHSWEREKYRRKSERIAERKSIWGIPLNSELKRWEKLSAQKRYKELYKEQAQKIEALLFKNKDLIDELLNPDFARKKIMDDMGIPYSPLLSLYSLTAYIFVRLFGRNPKLFEILLTHVKKVYTKRHGAPRGPDDQRARTSDLGLALTEAIAGFSKKPVLFSQKTSSLLVEAVERYLFTCVENAIKRDQMSESGFEKVDIETYAETLRAEPKSRSAMLDEAFTDQILSDPVDQIIYENYGETGLKIVDIVYKRLGKRMTRQAIEKRKTKNIKPLIEQSLKLKMTIRIDEGREGFRSTKVKGEKPLLRDVYRCGQCKKSFLTLYPLKRCRDHLGEKPFRP